MALYAKHAEGALNTLLDAGASGANALQLYPNVCRTERDWSEVEQLLRQALQATRNTRPRREQALPATPQPEADPTPQAFAMPRIDSTRAAAMGRADVIREYISFMPVALTWNDQSSAGKQPLSLAVQNNRWEVVKLLVENSDAINDNMPPGKRFDIDATDKRGMTALCYAIKANNQRMLCYLLQHGANPYIGPDGHALDYAIRKNRGFCAVALLRWSKDHPDNPAGTVRMGVDSAIEQAERLRARDENFLFTLRRLEHCRQEGLQ